MAGCGDAPGAPEAPPPPGVVASVLGVGSVSAQAPRPPVDAKALAEIVEAVPLPLPPTSASGTMVGSDTGITGSDEPEPPSDDGFVSLLPSWSASNAGSERDLRGTVYFDLVSQCRADDGSQLPPEAIEIELVVDSKGHIDRSSVKAKARSPEHEKAAACMTRTLRTSEARMTPPRLDKPVLVRARVPSID
jgi:hypothetical protein